MPNLLKALLIIASISLLHCGREVEKSEDFYPATVDGVHDVSLSYHTHELMFSGHWSAPVLGHKRKFYRTLGEGGGRIPRGYGWAPAADKGSYF